MSLLTKLRSAPKRLAVVAAVFLATAGAAATFAWGPDRPTFTMENPAPYVTFNSMTNNPTYGDEREFTMIKDLTTGEPMGDATTLVAGREYQVQIYVHNDASEVLNESGQGVARDTTVRATIPSTVNGNEKLYGVVRASNATPLEVYDSVDINSNGTVGVEYVSGSATLVTQYQNVALGDEIATTGVKVGDQDLSGNWRGCINQAGVIKFKIRVTQSDFTMSKEVRKHNTTTGGWTESYTAQPGEKVDYLIRYNNTGSAVQRDVTVKDVLPAGMTYIAGSTVLANGAQPNGAPAADTVTTTGLNIGTYAAGASAWVRFSAKIAANDALADCGENSLTNNASVTVGGSTKTDSAIVTVTKSCGDAYMKVCVLDEGIIRTIKENEFDATKHSKNFDDCKEVVCKIETKEKVTIEKKDFDAAVHTRDMSKCDKTSAIIPEILPSTGPGALLSGLFGSSALGLGISSFIRSRRALSDALNQ